MISSCNMKYCFFDIFLCIYSIKKFFFQAACIHHHWNKWCNIVYLMTWEMCTHLLHKHKQFVYIKWCIHREIISNTERLFYFILLVIPNFITSLLNSFYYSHLYYSSFCRCIHRQSCSFNHFFSYYNFFTTTKVDPICLNIE